MQKKILALLFGLIFSITSFAYADTQSLMVTGAVAPRTTDIPLTITNNTSGTVPQNTTVTYTITYGTHLLYADNITLEAYWDGGTISGNSNASIDGMSYVSGSASTAYGNTSPIINLTSQKISWSITSFPANTTNQTVSFQLTTNGSYTGSSTVDFPVRVRIIATNYTKPYEASDITYQYNSALVTPTPIPTSAPTTSSSGTNTTSPTTAVIPTTPPTSSTKTAIPVTSTSAPQSLTKPASNAPVQNLTLVNVSDSNTQIAVNLNKVSKATVVYGTTRTTLTNQSALTVNGTDGLIDLQNLAADTTYYMQLVTTDSKGLVSKSEVFAVQTAQTSATPEVAPASLVVASDNDVLYSAGLNKQTTTLTNGKTTPQIPIAQNSNYTFAFKLTKTNKIKSVSMTVKNTSVLGISTFHLITQPLEYSFPVVMQDNGSYSVQLKNPTTPGTYDVFIKITDYDGNISTQKVATITLLKPFRTYNALTKQPIEDVRIVLSKFNPETNRYEILPNFGGTSNPLYTNVNGEVTESLAKGRYKVNFGRIGYVEQSGITFSLGTDPKDDLPTVYLKPTAITPITLFTYYRNALTDFLGTSSEYIIAIQQSYRYFDLLGLLVIFCFVVMAFLLFSIRSHIHFAHIPIYFYHHLLHVLQRESPYMRGQVINQTTKLPLTNTSIFLIDEKTRHIIAQTTTNAKGFFLFNMKDGHHGIVAMKEGFEPSGQIGYMPNMVINLRPGVEPSFVFWNFLIKAFENSLGLFFEYTLVVSLTFEVMLFPAFGLWKTIPFLVASIMNIILWIFFLHETGKEVV